MAYETTTVTVSRSQEQVRAVLRQAGADRIMFGEVLTGPDKSAGVEFVHLGLFVRVVCPLKPPDPDVVAAKARRAQTRSRDQIADDLLEQEAKRVWRVLHWGIKARMESVAEGLETFEQAFLPHLVDPSTNRTIWESVRPAIEGGALQADGGKGLGSGLALGAGETVIDA
jgi:hypothetical protein